MQQKRGCTIEGAVQAEVLAGAVEGAIVGVVEAGVHNIGCRGSGGAQYRVQWMRGCTIEGAIGCS